MYGTPGGGAPRARKERKVSLVFRHPDTTKHCAGVESVLYVPHTNVLFTASRDSTVKRWDLSKPQPTLEASFEGHADWVNDVALIGDLLITCSNDQTVRLWKAGSPNGHHLHTLTYHSDYVTCLAAAPNQNLVASAGLRAEIFLLNVETGQQHQLYPQQLLQRKDYSSGSGNGPAERQHSLPSPGHMGSGLPAPLAHQSYGAHGEDVQGGSSDGGVIKGIKPATGSVYSLAMTPSATLLAAGTSEALIRLLDPRSGAKVAKLRGHMDTVRCLLLSPDGTRLVSGASDGTIKLWDIGMGRCVQTYSVHQDSVWALTPGDEWLGVVYSGGRDKAVYRTHLASRTSELLVCEQAPVRRLALELGPSAASPVGPPHPSASGSHHHHASMWVATTASSVCRWSLTSERDRDSGARHGPGAGPSSSSQFTAGRGRGGGAISGRMRASLDLHARQPLCRSPVTVIPGAPGIVMHEVMTDRRHVLTQDAEGSVALWDVLVGEPVQHFGKVDFATKKAELFEARSVPAWFSADHRLGSLCITLEPPGCFAAEEYAQALGYTDAPDDHKFNVGKIVLDAAFAKWRAKVAGHHHDPHHDPHGQQQLHLQADLHSQQHPSGTIYYRELWPRYWQCAAQPAVMCSTHQGLKWRRLLGQFTGHEREPDEIPTWVGDVVLRGAPAAPKEAKCAFVLLPAEGSNLPSLMQSKLNAPKILQVHKVAHYCYSKLAEQGVNTEVVPVYLNRPQGLPEPPQPSSDAPPALELMCGGMAVPYEMSLATIKKYIWKRSDDLVFHYRVRDAHTKPAPLPVLAPTAS